MADTILSLMIALGCVATGSHIGQTENPMRPNSALGHTHGSLRKCGIELGGEYFSTEKGKGTSVTNILQSITAEAVRDLRDELGVGMMEAMNILVRREMIKATKEATTIEELRDIILLILERNVK